ncbi:MAG: response regulator [Chloroflexi bacterium]|nr:MAG: response regulator [Chloroflexota bacterium]
MNEATALILEDDPVIGTVFQTVLNRAGFTVEIDATGGNFIKRLESPAPDLVLLDIHMPYASGLDILDLIRARETWKNSVVIVATADIFHSKSLGAKANHVLIKPVSVSKLIRIISEHWPERFPRESDLQS